MAIFEDVLGMLLDLEKRIDAVEPRVSELEQHKHAEHTIGVEALDQIAVHVEAYLMKRLSQVTSTIAASHESLPAPVSPVED